MSESGSVRGIRFHARRPDGRIILLEAGCMVQRDPAGTCTGIAGTLRIVSGEARPAREQDPAREG